MELIIGGAFQGKKEYALKKYPELTFQDGNEISKEELMRAEGVYSFELFLKKELQDPEILETLASELITQNPSIVLTVQELGYGVVPVNASDRAFREAVGRVCTELAAFSDTVTRVVCGIGQVIKQEKK
ncbi:MAG: bifunctional adenosylcobinamide kinase/adenosylcobinamide-phosphate guanylyltransferase [Blautia sp.]|nr:bifunctional adenosylcobinamide kinase/adenosylcobinamide-phosphate guanylyltransferase [Blautia sp.]